MIVDLDDRNKSKFIAELKELLDACNPRPDAHFVLAVEEGEAWLLGDFDAVKTAYPRAKTAVLDSYEYDSICGTWELLADAVYPGGHETLKQLGYSLIGKEKCAWANNITEVMSMSKNNSPSFQHFIKTLTLYIRF